MVLPALAAAETLAAEGLDVTVVNCRYLKPYDEVTLAAVLADHKQVLMVEEGTVVNGFGAFMASRHRAPRLDGARVAVHGVPDRDHPRGVARAAARDVRPRRARHRRRVRALLESEAMAG